MFHLSFVLGVSCCTENVNIHDDKSVNIFHDGLCFIFHLGRLFLYENCEHVFLYFLSILLLFLFFSLLKNSTLFNGHFDYSNIGEFYNHHCLGKRS